MSGKTAVPARTKRSLPITAALRAALTFGLVAGYAVPVAYCSPGLTPSGAAWPTTFTGTAAQSAPHSDQSSRSFIAGDARLRDFAGTPALRDFSGMPSLRASLDADASLWAIRGDAPEPAGMTLRYGAPILASMCRASPVLCVPEALLDTANDAQAGAALASAGAAETDSAAAHAPFAGAAPWTMSGQPVEDPRYVARAGHIEHDLHDALSEAGLPTDVVAQLDRLFAGRLGANMTALPDDGFRIVYERGDPTDAVMRHPHVTAAEIRLGEHTYSAVWFVAPGSTRGEYYAFDGKLLPSDPFAMPLDYERISSPFGDRLHPVSGEERFHTGVDLTAHNGAPVFAAAAGTVEFVGAMSGYGRNIVINHGDGYTTWYAHLSRFTRGLRPGDKVAQGQRIGSVGHTGVATGPHLHFEVRMNDQPVDPLALTDRDYAPPLTPAQRFSFERVTGEAREQLAAAPSVGTRVAANRTAPLF
jgi:murein DD-endopeptidase MepM/ murein hydrolase activator NlpD